MNLTDEPRTLYRGTRIGEAHAVTKYDRVEGRLPAVSRYDDDSKDSEDEGWLRDGLRDIAQISRSKDVLLFAQTG